jgi:lactoylglutathione lyase
MRLDLAKPALDVGLFTNRLDEMLHFWQTEAGVPFSELLPVGGGLEQHRHAIGQSVLKINHSRDPLPEAPLAGYRHLLIAGSGVATVREMADPDGNRISLVPPGADGIVQLRLVLVVTDLTHHRAFYRDVLGLPEPSPGLIRVGDSQILLEAGDAAPDPVQRARGYRYITLQVFDVKATHARILAGGGREGMAPVKLGDVAHISFVRDPDGNWIEISQRKSITGTLD